MELTQPLVTDRTRLLRRRITQVVSRSGNSTIQARVKGVGQQLLSGAAIMYGVPVAVAIAMTFRWFRPGQFVAAGDVSPFIRDGLATELWSGWTHQMTGAGSTSYEMTRSFDVAVIWIVDLFGGSLAAAQHVQYGLLAAFAAFGAAYFVHSVVTNRVVVGVVGVLAVANPLVMVSLPLVLPLLSIGVLGVLGGLVLRAAQGVPIRGVVIGLATVPMSYLAINPPNLATALMWVVVCLGLATLRSGVTGVRRASLTLLRALPWALALNLWWLIPLALTLRSGNAGVEVTAVTDAANWSWSHVNNSLGNVATLRAHWGWGTQEMLPYSRALSSPLWEAMRWILPLLAVVGAGVASRRIRPLAIGLVALGATLVFFGKGFHAPLSGVNAWLYHNVPMFWLLRDPVNKIGPPLVLVELMLASIAIETAARVATRMRTPKAVALRSVLVIVVTGALVAPWPLWSGEVIADDRGSLPSTHVIVPADWYRAADRVNESPIIGKALVLPLGSFYQLTTTWGYHGADNLAAMLLKRPVLQRAPGGYYSPVAGFQSLLDEVEQQLDSEDQAGVPALLRALGVSHVLVRKDLTSGQVVRPVRDHAVLTQSLGNIPGIRNVATSADVDVYEFAGGMIDVAAPVKVHSTDPTTTAAIVSGLPPGAAAISPNAVVGSPTPLIVDPNLGTPFNVESSGTFQVEQQQTIKATTIISRDSSGTTLEVRRRDALTIDSTPVPASMPHLFTVARDAPIAAEADETLHPLKPGDTLTVPATGDMVGLWQPAATQRVGDWSPLEDCLNLDARTPAAAGLDVELSASSIVLRATAHSACTWAPVAGDVERGYYLSIAHRTISGNPARICVWQVGINRCAALPALTSNGEWTQYGTFVQPEAGTKALRIYLYADGPDTGTPTVTEYRTPTVRSLAPLLPETIDSEDDLTVELSSGTHVLELASSQPSSGNGLGDWSSLEDCLRLDERDRSEAGLSLSVDDDTVRLSARAHSACTWAPIIGDPAGLHRLSLTYRTLSGAPGRICVWQVGPNRCADIPALAGGRDTATYSTIIQAEPGTTELRLYLYADGPDRDDASTTTEYNAITADTSSPITVRLTPTSTANPMPTITASHREATAEYSVSLTNARGPFLLILADTYARGWVVDGLPADWSADHLVTNGYSNGWLINGNGSAELTLRYQPDRTIRWVGMSSLVSLIAAAAVLIGARCKRSGVYGQPGNRVFNKTDRPEILDEATNHRSRRT